MKLTLDFFPNPAKASKKTGKIPLYLRLIFNRKKAEHRLNIEVQSVELKKWDTQTMRFTDRGHPANASLNKIDNAFNDFCYHNELALGEFDVLGIKDIVLGLDTKPIPLFKSYIEQYYTNTILVNTKMALGTKRNYNKAFKHLITFLEISGNLQITFKKVTSTFAFEFKDYLLASYPSKNKIGMTDSSALGIIKKIRSVVDRAIDEHFIFSNPFKKIKLTPKNPKRPRLDISQVKKIFDLDLREFPTQQLYKDIFLFSVFTGLGYAESNKLLRTDLNTTSGRSLRLFLSRGKTQIVTEMLLPEKAVHIVDKYADHSHSLINNKVLPNRSNKEVNIQLKILANMAGIAINLTTHIARHTFRQLLSEADIVEVAVIKRMMGHSRGSDIDDVYYSITESRLAEAKRKFDLYLNKTLI